MAIKIATLVKKANSTTMENDIAKLKRFYEVEIDVYRFFEAHGNGMAIQMFGSESFEKRNKGILLLEYVSDASYLKLWEHMSESDLIKMLKELAHLHSFTPRMDESYFAVNGKVLNNLFFERLHDEGVMCRLADANEFLKDNDLYAKLEDFTEKLRPLCRKFYEKADEMRLPKVFGHGDIWSGNVLYQKRSYKSMIDYQTCHFLHLGAEFGRMFAYMAGKNERKNFEIYSEMYLNELSALWPENGIIKDELIMSWELLFPFHYLISIFTRCLFCKQAADDDVKIRLNVKSIVADLLEEASDGLERIQEKYEF